MFKLARGETDLREKMEERREKVMKYYFNSLIGSDESLEETLKT